MKTNLLQPLNITEVKLWPTEASPRAPDEVVQEDEGLGLSAIHVDSLARVPAVYGGDGEIKR